MNHNEANRTSTPSFADLPVEGATRLRTLRDCFDQQLNSRKAPSIETFLSGSDVSCRAALLRELLLLEIAFRLQLGEVPEALEYLIRFPNDMEVVHRVFSTLLPGAHAIAPPLAPAPAEIPSIPHYILLSELGTGGMGTVYRAVHTLLKNEAAIKLLKTGREGDKYLRELFQREASNVGQLDHPRIVRALYAGVTESGQPYLVMELIHGLNMGQVVDRCGPISVSDACEVIRQAALGIQYAFERGMIHRDVKPSNLLLGWSDVRRQDAEVKVADFGLARLRRHNTSRAASETSEPVMGTFDYMAPEQFFAPETVDIRADIFSLGCTLYTLLTGKPPWARKFPDLFAKMTAQRDEQPPSFRHLRPDVPPALEELIHWTMAKAPADRFETPGEFAESLVHFNVGSDLPLLLETAQDRLATSERIRPAVSTSPLGS